MRVRIIGMIGVMTLASFANVAYSNRRSGESSAQKPKDSLLSLKAGDMIVAPYNNEVSQKPEDSQNTQNGSMPTSNSIPSSALDVNHNQFNHLVTHPKPNRADKQSPPRAKIKAKSLEAIMKHASPIEKKNISKLLSQIELIRIRTNDKGRTLFNVKRVAPQSLYSRLGIKPGDYVYSKNEIE